MRIISGSLGGRKVQMDDALPVRPTSDKARGAVFSSIAEKIPGATFLDVFAGTGAMGIEAISRGAEMVIAVEKSNQVVTLLKKNREACGILADRLEIINGDFATVLPTLRGKSFDVIFADPPYDLGFPERVIKLVDELSLLRDNGILIIEHFQKEYLPNSQGSLTRFKERQYGQTFMSFYHVGIATSRQPTATRGT